MDRVTRYPMFSNTPPTRVTSLVHDGDMSYTVELVGVGPEDNFWGQEDLQPVRAETRVRHGGHAVRGHLSPWSPYPESDEDEEMKGYLLGARDAHSPQLRDLEQKRWAVIQDQAVRKGGTVATLQRTPDPRDPGQPQFTPLQEAMIDREQIDFLAARQRFLKLEQASVDRAVAPRRPLAKALDGPHLTNGHVDLVTAQEKQGVREGQKARGFPAKSSIKVTNDPNSWPSATDNSHLKFQAWSRDSNDSTSQFQAPDYPRSWSLIMDDPGPQSPGTSPEPSKETPIEREIRLAQEREADLREQRGLQRAAGHQELVKIPTRQVLTKVGLTETPWRDRGRPSLYVQRDMVQGTQREEDHRREGLQVGRASTPDWGSEDPHPRQRRRLSSESLFSPGPDARASEPAPEEIRKVNRIPPHAYQPYLGGGAPQPEVAGFRAPSKAAAGAATETKAAASPKASGPPGKLPSTEPGRPKPSAGPGRESRPVVPRGYFLLRPLFFRVPDRPQQPGVPPTWSREAAGVPAPQLRRSPSSDLLAREVESVLRREQEVAAERRDAGFSPGPEAEGGGDGSRSSSRASGIMGSYSVSESPLTTPTHLHSRVVWTAEAPMDSTDPVHGTVGPRKKNGQWYAGINPSDGINSEILGATRVTRHKNAMAMRWEAGIYASEDED
ncbi:mitotic interactor and substrate of PLK1 [Ctenodactylus gundi]